MDKFDLEGLGPLHFFHTFFNENFLSIIKKWLMCAEFLVKLNLYLSQIKISKQQEMTILHFLDFY